MSFNFKWGNLISIPGTSGLAGSMAMKEGIQEAPKAIFLFGPDGLINNKTVDFCIRLAAVGAITYFSCRYLVNAIDPTKRQKQESREKAERLLARLGIDQKHELNEYELAIAAQLVDPSSIETSWEDVAGLDEVIEEIKATVIFPIKHPEMLGSSELHQPPKGILLHGPPGCGKTMLAKATAREAGARFINLEVPALTDKWYGESQKLAAAVFTLAIKLQPCIVFIDEIDTFLRTRDTHDHEATAMMKAQFMILWDGLIATRHACVIVMGATNRPNDVDKAILRRLPAMFQISRPNLKQRRAIVDLILRQEDVSDDVDLDSIAKSTDGFSGSDLRELCRSAAMSRIRELSSMESMKTDHFNGNTSDHHQHHQQSAGSSSSSSASSPGPQTLRRLSMKDFSSAIQKMKESKVLVAGSYSVFGLD